MNASTSPQNQDVAPAFAPIFQQYGLALFVVSCIIYAGVQFAKCAIRFLDECSECFAERCGRRFCSDKCYKNCFGKCKHTERYGVCDRCTTHAHEVTVTQHGTGTELDDTDSDSDLAPSAPPSKAAKAVRKVALGSEQA